MRQFVSLLSGVLIATVLTATPVSAAPEEAPRDSARVQSQDVSGAKAALKKNQTSATAKKKAKKKRKPLSRRALTKARTRAGMQYRYGASGPTAFDCSGLTSWAYKKAGKALPRTSGAQAAAAKRVRKPRRGDLVFFHNSGRVYHVGLYAGRGKVFHASRPGTPVSQAKIWTSSVFYGRV